jgi:hypothetical protein
MRWLLFLSRLAFICGIFFLLSLSVAIWEWTHDEAFSSTIIIIGYAIGLLVVPVTVLCYLGVIIAGKKLNHFIPRWLVIANIIFLFVLLYYIFYLNDPYYHQK